MVLLSLDVGQSVDHAALAAVVAEGEDVGGPRLALVHAERAPLGVSYGRLVGHVADVADAFTAAGHPVLVVADRTGIGRAVVEQLRDRLGHDQVLGVTWGSGRRLTGAWPDVVCPRQLMIDALLAVLQRGGLRILPGLPGGDQLGAELLDFRPGRHLGDLAASAAMAVWASVHVTSVHAWLSVVRTANDTGLDDAAASLDPDVTARSGAAL